MDARYTISLHWFFSRSSRRTF